MISVKNLCKSFGDFVAVHDLTFDIRPGEVVGFLGPNGAGKSTLLRTIAGMQLPLVGQVDLLGDAVHRLSAAELAQRVSIVLTERVNTGLLTGYALVALGRNQEAERSLEEALSLADAFGDLAKRLRD